MSTDPMADFWSAYRPARQAKDWDAQVDAANVLARRTARTALATVQVEEPEVTSTLELLAFTKDAAAEHEDRFTDPVPQPVARLKDLHRAFWWLVKSQPGPRTDGSLAADAPYRSFDHLMTCLYGDAQKVLVACPTAPRSVPWYMTVEPPADAASAVFEEIDEELFEEWWAVAHSGEQVDASTWAPAEAVLEPDTEWDDLIQLPDIETDVYCDRFRDAVESVRREGDTHAWLPITVVRGDERRQYWLPNVWGPGARDTWGLQTALAADRTVVLPAAGDSAPLFAGRVQAAAEQLGVALTWTAER